MSLFTFTYLCNNQDYLTLAAMSEPSALGPIDPSSIQNYSQDASGSEEEKAAPWIVRKLVGVSVMSF
jgi:hypothetical protein